MQDYFCLEKSFSSFVVFPMMKRVILIELSSTSRCMIVMIFFSADSLTVYQSFSLVNS